MAWQDMAKTLKMLASLTEGGSGGGSWTKKGTGKGLGKYNGAAPPETKRQCNWDDCKAAQGKKPTCGKTTGCHCCKRAWANAPPIERLVQWAYDDKKQQEQLKLKKQQSGKAKGKGKSAGKGNVPAAIAPGAAAAATSPEQLATLRKQRLEELKAGGAPATPTPSPTQEVARAFTLTNAEKCKPQPLELQEDLVVAAGMMATHANVVIKSLQSENFPASTPLESPGATLKRLLATSSPFTADEKRAAAEDGLAATNASIAAMEAGGIEENDEILLLLKARKGRQDTELNKWGQTATPARRRQALVIALEDFDGVRISRLEAQERGAAKALVRAKERTELLMALGGAVGDLQAAAD